MAEKNPIPREDLNRLVRTADRGFEVGTASTAKVISDGCDYMRERVETSEENVTDEYRRGMLAGIDSVAQVIRNTYGEQIRAFEELQRKHGMGLDGGEHGPR